MSKDLKKRGWSFVGLTTVYAFMQAMGLVNDHVKGCSVREAALNARAGLVLPRQQQATRRGSPNAGRRPHRTTVCDAVRPDFRSNYGNPIICCARGFPREARSRWPRTGCRLPRLRLAPPGLA